jgi:hypothetical protein
MFVSDDVVKDLAQIVHEVNRAFCESIGDNSQKPWSEAPEYNHHSAMAAVRAICDCPTLSPDDVHKIWIETKKSDGWKYGPTKDKDKMTHPSMIPYAELSSVEKYKDWLVLYVTKSYADFVKEEHLS